MEVRGLASALPLACGGATEALPDAGTAPVADAGEVVTDAGVAEPVARPVLPDTPFAYANQPLPQHFRLDTLQAHSRAVILDDNTPADNPTTDEGATLGRVLFYDQNLSQNRTEACASCLPIWGSPTPASSRWGASSGTSARRPSRRRS